VKEVHHRVKNNLQVISSLMNLQARHLKGRDPATVLEESQSRIFSIALVHERLYRSEDLAHVDFRDYAEGLTESIVHTFGSEDQVQLELDVDPIALPVDLAIPCGLIIHELLTNALKYAFPGGRRGKVSLTMARVGHNALLVVKDNGVGLPAEVQPGKGSSLGLFLVSTLVEQLEARFAISRENGTTFRIEFPIE
jgi:two-component system, sensor histidine kinase PdtaS